MTSHQLILATLQYDDPKLKLRAPEALRTTLTKLSAVLEQQGFTRLATNDRVPLECISDREFKDAALGAAQISDALVLYYTGHGYRQDDDSFRLLMRDSTLDNVSASGLAAQELAAQLRPGKDRTPPTVLLILDTCYAEEAGAALAWAGLAGHINPNVHVITTAMDAADPGEFAQFLTDILGSNTALAGHPRMGRAPHIQLGHIPALFNEEKQQKRAKYFPPIEGQDDFPPEFKNPSYVPGVAGQTIRDQQWWAKVRGIHGTETNELEGLYLTGVTGRRKALTRIAKWLNAEGPELVVVTGSPGSGKSVLLSLPVLLNGIPEDWREALTTHRLAGSSLVAFAAQTLPAMVDLKAIQVGGLNADTVAKQIAEWTHAPPTQDGESETDRLINHLLQSEPLAGWLILDGLDEARYGDGHKILHLAESIAATGTIRVLVGTRPHMVSDSKRNDPETVDLDRPEYRDPQALTTYVRQVLLATQESTASTWFQLATDQSVDAAAERIAEWATSIDGAESFLLAGSMAQGYRTTPWQPETPPWSQDRPDTNALFDHNMQTLGSHEIKTKIVLAALAWAKGPGLPRPGIWLAVARCLAEQQGLDPNVISSEDIPHALDHASGYIIEDIDPDGSGVYRPFHDLFTAYLQQRPPDDQLDTYKKWPQHKRDINRAITGALLSDVQDSNGAPDWISAPAYVRRYLIQHAADAGDDTLAELVADIDYLAVTDPTTTTPLLNLFTQNSNLALRGRVYRTARPRLSHNPAENALRLNESEAEVTSASSLSRLRLPYVVVLNCPTSEDAATLAFLGHTDTVTAVAFLTVEGQLAVASGSWDKTIRLWDPYTGSDLSSPLRGHSNAVTSIAGITLAKGDTLIASGSWDRTVRLWYPGSSSINGPVLIEHDDTVTAVALTTLQNGQVVLASGSADTSAQLWDPVESKPIGTRIADHTDRITSLAFSPPMPDGRTLLATGSRDKTVLLWDGESGERVGKAIRGHSGSVGSLAFGRLPGGQVVLATGSHDRTVRLWDPLNQDPYGRVLVGHTKPVTSTVFVNFPDDHVMIAAGSLDQTVLLWDPLTGIRLGEELRGHSDTVTSIDSVTLPNGRVVLGTGGRDKSVRIWDPLRQWAPVYPRNGHTKSVTSVAVASWPGAAGILASGSLDRTVRLWDISTGMAFREPLRGHKNTITSVALESVEDGSTILAAGSWDGTVYLWDPINGKRLHALAGHQDTVTCVAFTTLPNGQTLLATGSRDRTVQIWDPTNAKRLDTLAGHGNTVTSAVFSKDIHGRPVLATGSRDHKILLWEVLSGKSPYAVVAGHTDAVTAVDVATFHDGRGVLASASRDSTVRLWDLTTGNPLGKPLTGHTGRTSAVAFAAMPDAQVILATGGEDRLLIVRLNYDYWAYP